MSIVDRRAWAANVLRDLMPQVSECSRAVIYAGARYREFIVGPLESKGFTVEIPMLGLRQGEQLAWLAERS